MLYKAINENDGMLAEVYDMGDGAYKIVLKDADADEVIANIKSHRNFVKVKEIAEHLVGNLI